MSFHAELAPDGAGRAAHADAVRLLLDIVTGTRRAEPAAAEEAGTVAPGGVRREPEPTPREIRALIRDEIIPAAKAPVPPRCVVAEACPAAPRGERCDPRCSAAARGEDREAVDAEWEPA